MGVVSSGDFDLVERCCFGFWFLCLDCVGLEVNIV